MVWVSLCLIVCSLPTGRDVRNRTIQIKYRFGRHSTSCVTVVTAGVTVVPTDEGQARRCRINAVYIVQCLTPLRVVSQYNW